MSIKIRNNISRNFNPRKIIIILILTIQVKKIVLELLTLGLED